VTISGNNNTLIKDWIRPLQKSLTIETENKFINTLGNQYLSLSPHTNKLPPEIARMIQ